MSHRFKYLILLSMLWQQAFCAEGKPPEAAPPFLRVIDAEIRELAKTVDTFIQTQLKNRKSDRGELTDELKKKVCEYSAKLETKINQLREQEPEVPSIVSQGRRENQRNTRVLAASRLRRLQAQLLSEAREKNSGQDVNCSQPKT